MVVVAQLVERQIVVLDVVGSIPVFHPRKKSLIVQGLFSLIYNLIENVFVLTTQNQLHPINQFSVLRLV